jgi:hypothetical protein
MGLQGNPDEIAFRFHWTGIQLRKVSRKRTVHGFWRTVQAGKRQIVFRRQVSGIGRQENSLWQIDPQMQ